MMKPYYFLVLFCFPLLLYSQNIPKEYQELWRAKAYVSLALKLEQLVSNDTTNLEALELLGDVYGRMEDWERAAACYEQLTLAMPNEANYHFKYGGVLGMMAKENSKFKALGLINQTKKSFSKAARLDPSHWAVRWAQVELHVQLPAFLGGSYNKALEIADELEAISELNGYFAKAYIYTQKKDEIQSKKFIKKGVKIRHLASCLSQQNQTKECTTHNNTLHYDLALACMTNDLDVDAAGFLFRKFIADFNSADRVPLELAHFQLSKLLLKQHHTEDALVHLNYALKLNPNFDLAKNEKKRILMHAPN